MEEGIVILNESYQKFAMKKFFYKYKNETHLNNKIIPEIIYLLKKAIRKIDRYLHRTRCDAYLYEGNIALLSRDKIFLPAYFTFYKNIGDTSRACKYQE